MVTQGEIGGLGKPSEHPAKPSLTRHQVVASVHTKRAFLKCN